MSGSPAKRSPPKGPPSPRPRPELKRAGDSARTVAAATAAASAAASSSPPASKPEREGSPVDTNPHPFTDPSLLSEPLSPNTRAARGLPPHAGAPPTGRGPNAAAAQAKLQAASPPDAGGDALSPPSPPTEAGEAAEAGASPPPPPRGAKAGEGTPTPPRKAAAKEKRLSIEPDAEVLEGPTTSGPLKSAKHRTATPHPSKSAPRTLPVDEEGEGQGGVAATSSPPLQPQAPPAPAPPKARRNITPPKPESVTSTSTPPTPTEGSPGGDDEAGSPAHGLPPRTAPSPPPVSAPVDTATPGAVEGSADAPPSSGGVSFRPGPPAALDVPVSPEVSQRGGEPASGPHRKPAAAHVATPFPKDAPPSSDDEEEGAGGSRSVGFAPDSPKSRAAKAGMTVRGGALVGQEEGTPPQFTPAGAPGGDVPTPHPDSTSKRMDFTGVADDSSDQAQAGGETLTSLAEDAPTSPRSPPAAVLTDEVLADRDAFAELLARAVVAADAARAAGDDAAYRSHLANLEAIRARYAEFHAGKSPGVASPTPRSPYAFNDWMNDASFARELRVVLHDIRALQQCIADATSPVVRAGLDTRLRGRVEYLEYLKSTWRQVRGSEAVSPLAPASAMRSGDIPTSLDVPPLQQGPGDGSALAEDGEAPPPPPPSGAPPPTGAHLPRPEPGIDADVAGGDEGILSPPPPHPEALLASAEVQVPREVVAQDGQLATTITGRVAAAHGSALPDAAESVHITRRHLLQLYQLYAARDARGLFRDASTGELGLSRRMWLLFVADCPKLLGWSFTAAAAVELFTQRQAETTLFSEAGARQTVYYITFPAFLDCLFDAAQTKFDPAAVNAALGPHPASPGGIAAIFAQAATAMGGVAPPSAGWTSTGAVHEGLRGADFAAVNVPLHTHAGTLPHGQRYTPRVGGTPGTPLSLVGTPGARAQPGARTASSGLSASQEASRTRGQFAGRLRRTATGHVVVDPPAPGQATLRSSYGGGLVATIGEDAGRTARVPMHHVAAMRAVDGTEPMTPMGVPEAQRQRSQQVLPPHPSEAAAHAIGADLVDGSADVDAQLPGNAVLDALQHGQYTPASALSASLVGSPSAPGAAGAQDAQFADGLQQVHATWGKPEATSPLSPSKKAPSLQPAPVSRNLRFRDTSLEEEGGPSTPSSQEREDFFQHLSPPSRRIMASLSPRARRAAQAVVAGERDAQGIPLQAGSIPTTSLTAEGTAPRASGALLGPTAAPALNLRDDTERLALLLHLYVAPLWEVSFAGQNVVELSLPPYHAA